MKISRFALIRRLVSGLIGTIGILVSFIPSVQAQVNPIIPDTKNAPIPVPGFAVAPGPAGQGSVFLFIISLINFLLLIVGILSVLFIIIGGFRYVLAHGNEEQAEDAKKTILHSIIGLVIVILSFVIVRIIANALILGEID